MPFLILPALTKDRPLFISKWRLGLGCVVFWNVAFVWIYFELQVIWLSSICQGWNSLTRTWALFTQGLYKYTITMNIGSVAVLYRKMFLAPHPPPSRGKEWGRKEDWFACSLSLFKITYGRYLCVLKTNHVAVSMKICTYMCTFLNWVRGALSGLTGDIVQCTSNLQVF